MQGWETCRLFPRLQGVGRPLAARTCPRPELAAASTLACHSHVYEGGTYPREAARCVRAFPAIGIPASQPDAGFRRHGHTPARALPGFSRGPPFALDVPVSVGEPLVAHPANSDSASGRLRCCRTGPTGWTMTITRSGTLRASTATARTSSFVPCDSHQDRSSRPAASRSPSVSNSERITEDAGTRTLVG